MSELIGKKHHQLLKRLADWQNNSKSKTVAIIEGFSGTGKTSIAREFTASLQEGIPHVLVNVPESGTDILNDMLLDLAGELDIVGVSDLVEAIDKGSDLKIALQKILLKKVVIVLDEFQNAFEDDTNKPLKEFSDLLSKIANRTGFSGAGRLLLLTNRAVERKKWSEFFEFLSLEPLTPTEAEELLTNLLKEADKEADIPLERRRDVVNWLGRYPRALTVLVASLEYESLDTLIGKNPDSWDLREDRKVSQDLLHKLEEKLLKGILERLSEHSIMLLRRLAVYRKPFVIEALDNAATNRSEATELREALINAFLLKRQGTSSYFALNEVAREIALYQLGKSKEIKTAHSLAADHYYRHFKAKKIETSGGQLGGYFVEARYHLAKSGRFDDISQLSMLFSNYLKLEMGMKSPIPANPEEIEERIALLAGLLEHFEIMGLEYYLARLLQKRNSEGDLQRALHYAQRATISSDNAEVWRMSVSLELEVNGIKAAISQAKIGLTKIFANYYAIRLYRLCGELLAKDNRLPEAITVLQEGIAKVPTDKNSWELYLKCGELLAEEGWIKEAITLLQEGIAKIPVEKGCGCLYHRCGELLANDQRPKEAIVLLEEGIVRVPVESVSPLYLSCAEILAKDNRVKEAIVLLQEGIAKAPVDSVWPLFLSCAEMLAKDNRVKEAIALLQEGIVKVPVDKARNNIIDSMLSFCVATQDIDTLNYVVNLIGGSYIENCQKSLGKIRLAQLELDWQNAAEIAHAAYDATKNYTISASQESFSWFCAGEMEKAYDALQTIPNLEFQENNPSIWLKAFICLRSQRFEEANEAIVVYLGHPLEEELTEKFLLQLWDQQDSKLCYYFPMLPSSLTGLSEPVTRLPFMPPVLPYSRSFPLTHTVYVEGITDELYLKKAIEVFDKYALGLDIKCRGVQGEGGSKGSGSAMLDKFVEVHKHQPEELPQKTTVLYDSDTKKKPQEYGEKLRVKCMPENSENTLYKIGIENLLTLPEEFPQYQFFDKKIFSTTDNYGATTQTEKQELNKKRLCDWICNESSIDQRFYLQKFEQLLENVATPML